MQPGKYISYHTQSTLHICWALVTETPVDVENLQIYGAPSKISIFNESYLKIPFATFLLLMDENSSPLAIIWSHKQPRRAPAPQSPHQQNPPAIINQACFPYDFYINQMSPINSGTPILPNLPPYFSSHLEKQRKRVHSRYCISDQDQALIPCHAEAL